MHDSRGASLKVGDRVLLEAEVTQVSEGDAGGYCNVTVQIKTPDQVKPPEMSPPTLSSINTKMLTKVGAAILLVCSLIFLASTASAADAATDLPARVETNQYLPPAPGAVLAPRADVEVNATAAALPGQPVVRAARAVRNFRPFRLLFRGRAGRGCG